MSFRPPHIARSVYTQQRPTVAFLMMFYSLCRVRVC